MRQSVIINVINKGKYTIPSGTTAEDFIKQANEDKDIIAISIEGEVVDLNYKFIEDTTLKYIYKYDSIGNKIYRSALKYIYIVAIKELYKKSNVILLHSIDQAIYTELSIPNEKVTEETVKKIKDKMKEIIKKDYKIEKVSTSRKNAIEYYESVKEFEKADHLKQITNDYVTLYQLLNYYNYFYSIMPISTGIIDTFDLSLDKEAIILKYPRGKENKIPEYTHLEEVTEVFRDYKNWQSIGRINYVSDVNNVIVSGKIDELIQINEIKQNMDLLKLMNKIKDSKEKIKLILIGGPSSSGKTTMSKKISLFLKSNGYTPFMISTDDYFKEREDTDKDKDGNYLFDQIDAIDINLFNDHITKLLNGDKVKMPTFNFINGKKEYIKEEISLKETDIIIMEGLHTLNEELTKSINKKNKFKIYISPFTPVGLDRHNYLSTVDLRFLRKLVRDHKFRGYSAEQMLKNWAHAREQEEKYVYPYQKEADAVLNTAFLYEINVLKPYALPLLYSIKLNSEYYEEAIRIIRFLDCFFGISSEELPTTTLLREFIGNGYY